MDTSEEFLECVERWAQIDVDGRINTAMNEFEEWINNFDDSEKDVLINLLKSFNYYTLNSIMNIIGQLSIKSKNKFDVTNGTSVVSVIRKKDGKLGSSSEYLILHRTVSELSKNIYYDSLDDINEVEWGVIKNVVFVDDCSGTGKTFVNFLKRQRKPLSGKRIILIVIEIMEEAKKYIEKYSLQCGLDIEIIAHNIQKKAFIDTPESQKTLFDVLSRRQTVENAYIRGFKNTEALMAFFNNTPNNTLGIFWYPTIKNKPIFLRELDEIPAWKKINNNKQKRTEQQYDAKRG